MASTRGRGATIEADIDPRIAARRDAVENEKRRRQGRWWLILAIFAAVLVGGWLITRTSLLDVDAVEVRGAVVTTTDEILSVSGIRIGQALLEVDTAASAVAIRQLPFIETAAVARNWDGTVVISVTERIPVAMAMNSDEVWMLVDRSGRVLAPHVAGDGLDTEVVGAQAGPPGSEVEGVDGALEVASLLGPGLRTRVISITTAPDGSLSLALRPQGTVLLGPATDLNAKVDSMRIVMAQVDQRDLASINVVNPSTPVVVRTPK
ncbi:MAG: FtsQ-type POTRA domain-containing protein [Acidimicrobiales bacterium]